MCPNPFSRIYQWYRLVWAPPAAHWQTDDVLSDISCVDLKGSLISSNDGLPLLLPANLPHPWQITNLPPDVLSQRRAIGQTSSKDLEYLKHLAQLAQDRFRWKDYHSGSSKIVRREGTIQTLAIDRLTVLYLLPNLGGTSFASLFRVSPSFPFTCASSKANLPY